jgi:hypothetical protein
MKKHLLSVMIIVLALVLGACTDPGLEGRIATLERRVKTLQTQNETLETQVEILTDDLTLEKRRSLALTTIATDHEFDFYYLYLNLGWNADIFANWSDHSDLWQAAWGCSDTCGWTGYTLREYK